jgi:hypothetical protein
MPKVFVSYAKEDAAVAQRIALFLEEQALACWIAPRDVPAGVEYGAAILEGIEQSDVLLLVLSEQSNQSQFVHREVERAVSKAKPVLPVRIREIAPSGALEFFISSAQWVDAWQPPMEQHLAHLVQAIRALTGGAAAEPAPATRLKPPPARRGPNRRALAAAGVVVLALAAGLLAWSPWSATPAGQAATPAAGPAPAPSAAATAAVRPTLAQFLAGTWCQPMSGDAKAYWAFTALAPGAAGQDRVGGELSFSHSTEVQRFEAEAAWIGGEGLALTFTDPPDLAGGAPLAFRTDGNDRLKVVETEPDPNSPPPQPLTRCKI